MHFVIYIYVCLFVIQKIRILKDIIFWRFVLKGIPSWCSSMQGDWGNISKVVIKCSPFYTDFKISFPSYQTWCCFSMDAKLIYINRFRYYKYFRKSPEFFTSIIIWICKMCKGMFPQNLRLCCHQFHLYSWIFKISFDNICYMIKCNLFEHDTFLSRWNFITQSRVWIIKYFSVL